MKSKNYFGDIKISINLNIGSFGSLYIKSRIKIFLNNQREIMDVLFDIFRFSVPDWTDDFAQAIASIGEMNSNKFNLLIHKKEPELS